jgi:acyl CoA:acetate/3-ketoacid CoA transferase beta subunit
MVDRIDVADLMVCALAREVRDGDFVGVGLGTPLALAAALVARATHAPGARVLAGGVFDARATLPDYMRGASGLAGKSSGYISHIDSMDMAERQTMTLQFLRPAQVDGAGSMNTSRIPGDGGTAVRFPGGLATADVPKLLPRVVVYLPAHRPRNLPAQVAYVTGSGAGWTGSRFPSQGVVSIVTDLACIRIGSDRPRLESVHPWASVDDVRRQTGFELETEGCGITPTPDDDEMSALGDIDPAGLRATEVRAVPEPSRGGIGS